MVTVTFSNHFDICFAKVSPISLYRTLTMDTPSPTQIQNLDIEVAKDHSNMPIGWRWRSSYRFATLVIGLGLAVDMLTLSIVTPALPFQLQKLGYHDISSLVGWLLFAYSIGLVLATFPITAYSEGYRSRKLPMIISLFVLAASQVFLMFAPNFPTMIAARFVQGIGSSGVWVIGMALMCDDTPEELLGSQLGLAMSGISIGLAFGPPVGGYLYSHYGFRAPIMFALAVSLIDLVGRFLILGKKEIDREVKPSTEIPEPGDDTRNASGEEKSTNGKMDQDSSYKQSLLQALCKLTKSPRAIVTLLTVFVYGNLQVGRDPSMVLHLESVWGLGSGGVGLVFLIASAGNIPASIVAGWCVDCVGVEIVSTVLLLLACPWWGILSINSHLELLVAAFAIEYALGTGVLSALAVELAIISSRLNIGCAHVLGSSNIAYSLGSAVGPVIIGSIYDHVKSGWIVICLSSAGLIFCCFVLSFFYIGSNPLWSQLLQLFQKKPQSNQSLEKPA